MTKRILKDKGQRVLAWFSCGAASAVAVKMALAKYGKDRVTIAYIDTGSEHPDNWRFIKECSEWYGKEILILRNNKYQDTWAVWEKVRFIMSPHGAPCTTALKKSVRQRFEDFEDIQVFGYTSEEANRAERFAEQNFEVMLDASLIEAGLDKSDCFAILERAGIDLPAMYHLGYPNNNCIGCPKGGMGYWNMIRRDFPEVFDRMADLQRELNVYFWTEADGTPIFLDQLAPDRGKIASEPDFSCSLLCYLAEQSIEPRISK
ncbi:phosphoadenosine phosphosulfate reductase family protein [Aestuariispira insulae]|uniref:3'-phosphoadenosine 5'-phosphosulfate sulfotransferase (PAPS reductase)/FAD synthetase n=1 Tax=Aestuariispira insulae TaxID=1461337 RepID=A0A3D9H3N6_9PROT|nr:phosphoadenosine phosphosulfate reductase family protein [Aestuariispira insulae]RED44099.1 3'-phosphoadenosine 5'-phosphosulfate sulfotransferase (PAPS reductase)/FAD synthetase [Aestuariispira insulae]